MKTRVHDSVISGHPRLLLVAVAWLLAPQLAHAQGANLWIFRGSSIFCPEGSGEASVTVINLTTAPQTIAAGAVMNLTFSAPVLRILLTAPAEAVASFSGNAVTLTFTNALTVPDSRLAAAFARVLLDLRGLRNLVPVSVTITTSPANAVSFPVSGNRVVVGITDATVCQLPPESVVTFEELMGSCPSAEEIRAFNSALSILFESDPSAGTLVCRAADGSADLTLLQERTYQALRLMKQLSFDAPLPWTARSLYDWFVGAIRGIRFRGDIENSSCCDSGGRILIQTRNLAVLQFPDRPEWLDGLASLFAHEARHNEPEDPGHTCGPFDRAISELGAIGVQYYLGEWVAFRSGSFLFPRGGPRGPAFYHEWPWRGALDTLSVRICDREGGLSVSPRSLNFGAQPVGAATAPRTVAVTATAAPATIGGIGVTGAHAADFTVSGPGCSGAAAPPSCPVLVSFRPGAQGARSALLTVNSADGSVTRTASLSGTGAGPGACSYSLSPTGQSFTVPGGAGSVAVTAAPGCNWTATSASPWITASGQAGSGSGTLAYTVLANTGTSARQGTMAIAGQTVSVAQGGVRRPRFTAAGITNAASFLPGITPGGIATIFGSELTTGVRGRILAADRLPLPTQLAGTSVRVNGIDAPLFAVANVEGQEQINLQVPYELAGQATATVVVINSGVAGAPAQVPVLAAQPGIFTVPGTTLPGGYSLGVITHGADGRLVTRENPARRGEVVVIYATGLGPVSPAPRTGAPATAEPLSWTVTEPVVIMRGQRAEVQFSGLTPGFVALYQVNIRIPEAVIPGTVETTIEVQGRQSQQVIVWVL